MSLSLSMNVQFNTTVEKLWSALTDPDKLAKWIADNDFQPVVRVRQGERSNLESRAIRTIHDHA